LLRSTFAMILIPLLSFRSNSDRASRAPQPKGSAGDEEIQMRILLYTIIHKMTPKSTK
jgi:hypothetical protein